MSVSKMSHGKAHFLLAGAILTFFASVVGASNMTAFFVVVIAGAAVEVSYRVHPDGLKGDLWEWFCLLMGSVIAIGILKVLL